MQYIVVLSIHTTPYISFPAVFRSCRAQRLAKERKKALFLRILRQTGSRKSQLSQGGQRWNFIQKFRRCSQIKNRQSAYTNLRHLRIPSAWLRGCVQFIFQLSKYPQGGICGSPKNNTTDERVKIPQASRFSAGA